MPLSPPPYHVELHGKPPEKTVVLGWSSRLKRWWPAMWHPMIGREGGWALVSLVKAKTVLHAHEHITYWQPLPPNPEPLPLDRTPL